MVIVPRTLLAFAQNRKNDSLEMDPTHYSGPQFLFTHQSQGIQFSEWISILTLCLTPLLVHISAGYPSIVIIRGRGPSFIQRLCHLNPTSIFWRYYAIADRRVRSKCWTEADMAASNSAFWTGHGWDGSEEMMVKSRPVCTRKPHLNRVPLLSLSAFKTLIVAVQGVQAIQLLVTDAMHGSMDITTTTVFFPLAILGLQRLWASLWLADHSDYEYANSETWEPTAPLSTLAPENTHVPPTPRQPIQPWTLSSATKYLDHCESSSAERSTEASHKSVASYSALAPEDPLATAVHLLEAADKTIPLPDLYAQNSWRGIVVTILCVALPSTLLVYTLYFVILDYALAAAVTASIVAFQVLYTMVMVVTTMTLGFCIIRGQRNTTIIPVFHMLWYKIYTVVLLTTILSALVISALEIRRMPCGIYTGWPRQFDAFHCRYGSA